MTNADKLNCDYWGNGCVKGTMCASDIRRWLESEVDFSGVLR